MHANSGRTTVSTSTQSFQAEQETVVVLQPSDSKRTKERKKVEWTQETIDNEDMNKKKSKCCCIYTKRRNFGESDSESSENECDNCYGHVEKKKIPN